MVHCTSPTTSAAREYPNGQPGGAGTFWRAHPSRSSRTSLSIWARAVALSTGARVGGLGRSASPRPTTTVTGGASLNALSGSVTWYPPGGAATARDPPVGDTSTPSTPSVGAPP